MMLIFSIIVFLISLSIIVIIHELGHFLMARKFGIKVLEFAVGFPPRIWSKMSGETAVSINAIPLGGYVHLLGEDEAEKENFKTAEKQEEWQSGALSSKPAWQRVIVLSGGVIMNILLAWVIFTIVLVAQGFSYRMPLYIPFHFVGVSQTNKNAVVISQVENKSLAKTLTVGDQVLSVNGKTVNGVDQFEQALLNSRGTDTTLVVTDLVDQGTLSHPKSTKTVTIKPLQNPAIEVLEVSTGSPAEKAGIHPGDLITQVNNQPIKGESQFSDQVKTYVGKEIDLTILNPADNSTKIIHITPRVNPPPNQGAIGIGIAESVTPGVEIQEEPLAYLSYNTPVQKVFSGLIQGYNELIYSVTYIGQLIGQSIADRSVQPTSQVVHGVIAIGYFSDLILQQPNPVLKYLDLMGEISLSLALFNILPLPALDGGRIFFMVIEMISRKKVNPQIEAKVHYIGFIILIGLSLLVAYNDIQQYIWPSISHMLPH